MLLWPSPPTSGVTDYIFNNLAFDVGNLEYLNFGGTAGNNANGNYVLFNNTWQSDVQQSIVRCAAYTNGTVSEANDHNIDDQNPLQSGCTRYTGTTNLWQSNTSTYGGIATGGYSNANTSPKFDQYTNSGALAYSPVVSTNSTVGTGTNEQSYCSALSTAASSDSTLSDAASACQSDTRYACTYAGNGAPLVCPARTANVRPTNWDIGAYQYLAAGPPAVYSGIVLTGVTLH